MYIKRNDDADDLYTVMFCAQMEDSGNKFAQDIKTYPNPAILLASDRQLKDVTQFQFCYDPFESCIFTIDPTFSIGDFDVTSFSNVYAPNTLQGFPFICLARTKSWRASVNLVNGEKALISAFSYESHLSRHLTCSIHVCHNMRTRSAKKCP